MPLVPVHEIFNVNYGNSLSLNNLEKDSNGINFVSRTSKNNGVSAIVKPVIRETPFSAGTITVAVSGSVMESFLQPKPYYTAFHVLCLTPKFKLTDQQKLFYCYCLKANKHKFNYGRQANKTLSELPIPSLSDIPKWIKKSKLTTTSNKSILNISADIKITNWIEFRLETLFNIVSSDDPLLNTIKVNGKTPYVSSTEYNNGIRALVDLPPSNEGNVLTVNRGGSVGKTFYQPKHFLATKVDVRILKPKFKINQYIGLFLSCIIEKEKYRFNYSRKMGTDRLKKLKIKLPSTSKGKPDWQFMEAYIKSLPYSSNL